MESLMIPDFSLAILAGGKSSRFEAGNKQLHPYKSSKTLIEATFKTVNGLFSETIIVANSHIEEYKLLFPESKVVSDSYIDKGPLAGIHAALTVSKNPYVFVIACDMPNIQSEMVREMLNSFRKKLPVILVPEHEGKIEPLHSVYSISCLKKVQEILAHQENPKIRNLFSLVKTEYWSVPEIWIEKNVFFNVNFLSDI